MDEIGIDIKKQYSKIIDEMGDVKPDIVITLCDSAKESCPIYPNARRKEHWSLPDPADATGTRDEILSVYCAVRDELQKRIKIFRF